MQSLNSIMLPIKKQWLVASRTEDIRSAYTFIRELGTGAFGRVLLASDKTTGETRAIKQIQKIRVKDYISFQNEIKILRHLDHPNIVKILETFESAQFCYLVLEHCEGPDLFSRISSNK